MENEYKCEWCGKTYTTQSNLTRHKKTSKYCNGTQKEIELTCGWCGKIFCDKSNLSRHTKISKVCKKIQNDIICGYCGFESDKKDEFINHKSKCISMYRITKEKADKYETEIKNANDKIRELELKLSESKGYIKCAKENISHNKSIINTNSNNTVNKYVYKINTVITSHMNPFDTNLIQNNINSYTFELFLKGMDGVVDFLLPLMRQRHGNDIERNYCCSDVPRKSFNRLVKNERSENQPGYPNEWDKDPGALYVDKALDKLKDQFLNHWERLKLDMKGYKMYVDSGGYYTAYAVKPTIIEEDVARVDTSLSFRSDESSGEEIQSPLKIKSNYTQKDSTEEESDEKPPNPYPYLEPKPEDVQDKLYPLYYGITGSPKSRASFLKDLMNIMIHEIAI